MNFFRKHEPLAHHGFEVAASSLTAVAHFVGSADFFGLDPGACAPGFMLSPAPESVGKIDLRVSVRSLCLCGEGFLE